jgi:hypothetical protein
MLNSIVESMFKDVKPMNNPTVTVRVEMEPSGLMTSLAEGVVSEIERIASSSGQVSTLSIEVEDVLKAFKTLVFLRVNSVNHVGGKTMDSYRSVKKHFAVPVLVYQLLIPMGIAYDKDYSIEFVPETKIAGEDLLAPQEMMALSDAFRRLENYGFKVVYGIPESEEGELQFMAMAHVGEEVLSYRTKDHPVYAFLASFFRQQTLNEVTGMMCRILYGYESDYRFYINRLLSSINGGQ